MNDFNFNITDIDYVTLKTYPLGSTYSTPLRHSYRIVYIFSGEGEHQFKDHCLTANSDNVVLHQPGENYTLTSVGEEPWSFCVISFFTDSPLPSIPAVSTPRHGGMIRDLFVQADKVWSYKNPGYMLKLKSILFTVLYELIKSDVTELYSSSIDKAVKFIKTNYNRKLTVSDLAEVSGYSPSHFNSEFVRLVGKSPMRFLNEIRIERAKELLRTGLFSIGEIADTCGFENTYYFSNVFKKYTGVSPSKF